MHVSDWVVPVPGIVFQAQCRWCKVELRANYNDLKLHLGSARHTAKALMYNVVAKTDISAQASSILGKEPAEQGDSLISDFSHNTACDNVNV